MSSGKETAERKQVTRAVLSVCLVHWGKYRDILGVSAVSRVINQSRDYRGNNGWSRLTERGKLCLRGHWCTLATSTASNATGRQRKTKIEIVGGPRKKREVQAGRLKRRDRNRRKSDVVSGTLAELGTNVSLTTERPIV